MPNAVPDCPATDSGGYRKTYWICDPCGRHGVVLYADDAGVVDVVRAIEVQHAAQSAEGGPCAFDLWHLRVSAEPLTPPEGARHA